MSLGAFLAGSATGGVLARTTGDRHAHPIRSRGLPLALAMGLAQRHRQVAQRSDLATTVLTMTLTRIG